MLSKLARDEDIAGGEDTAGDEDIAALFWRRTQLSRKVVNIITFGRRNYFFLILAHSVYKMWIIQAPNKLALWNKLHFEEKKMESIEHV